MRLVEYWNFTFLHSHVLYLNVLHELIDDILGIHPAPVQLLPPLVLLHGPEADAGVRGAGAGVAGVRGVLGALAAVRPAPAPAPAQLAGLAAVARAGLALGG